MSEEKQDGKNPLVYCCLGVVVVAVLLGLASFLLTPTSAELDGVTFGIPDEYKQISEEASSKIYFISKDSEVGNNIQIEPDTNLNKTMNELAVGDEYSVTTVPLTTKSIDGITVYYIGWSDKEIRTDAWYVYGFQKDNKNFTVTSGMPLGDKTLSQILNP